MGIQFTSNYTDHSNSTGFQFEFHCDKCRNGWRSSFAPNALGVASGLLRAASNIFGGALGKAAAAGEQMKDALRGPAWDNAFSGAVTEGKKHFKHCTRCGKWVCPQACWNEARALCEACAPDLGEETAAAQAQAAVSKVREKAQAEVEIDHVDLKTHQAAQCPHCQARNTGGKFCGSCGKPMAATRACPKCKAKVVAGAKFCGDCGSAV